MATEMLDQANSIYYTCHGKIITDPDELARVRASGQPVRAWPRLLGGKGGFGSLLRSIGSQIDKTTNREMCRDLSGRRMRDVNNQKRLAEWAAGADARAAERRKRREEKRQRRRQLLASTDGPSGHVMEDGSYLVEKERIVDSVFTAVKEALDPRKRPIASASTSAAASSAAAGPSRPAKLAKKWLDADLEDLESSGSNSSSSAEDDGQTEEKVVGSQQIGQPVEELEQAPQQELNQTPEQELEQASQQELKKAPEQELKQASQQELEQASQQELEQASQQELKQASQQELEQASQQELKKAPELEQTSQQELKKAPEPELEQASQQEAEQAQPVSSAEPADASTTDEPIDLSTIDSLEAAEALGLEALKVQLRLRGLKCGGSLADRARRLLAVRGLTPDKYPAALLARPAKK